MSQFFGNSILLHRENLEKNKPLFYGYFFFLDTVKSKGGRSVLQLCVYFFGKTFVEDNKTW